MDCYAHFVSEGRWALALPGGEDVPQRFCWLHPDKPNILEALMLEETTVCGIVWHGPSANAFEERTGEGRALRASVEG